MPRDDGLAGFRIGIDAERRVLRHQLRQRDAELLLVGLRLRLDGDLDDGIGKFHLFQDDRLLRIAQRVAGAGLLEAGQRDDVARIGLLDVLAVVGVHQQHAADPLLAFAGRVDDAGAARQRARIDAAERDGADIGIVHDLERQQRQRLLVVGLAHHFVALVVDALDRRHVERRRQIVDHGVEQRLDALVLERRAGEHREERAGDHGLADQPLEGRDVRLLAVQIGGQDLVIELDRGLEQLVAIFQGLILQIGGNLDVVVIGAERFVLPDHPDHAHQIDDAAELVLGADRKLDRDRLGAQALDDIGQAAEEVGADLVHLVGEDDARHLVFVALAPHRFGLRLDALVGIEHAYGAVEHAQRALHLDGEVDMPGGVDDVEALAVPERGGRGRGDGDAALLLLLHPVHGGGALMDLADLVALAGVIENPLGRRRLPGIDVGHDAEIAIVFDRVEAGHGCFLTSGNARRRGWPPPCGGCLPAS